MSETFTGTMKIAATGTLTSSSDLQTSTSNLNYSKTYTIANGTGADMANNVWSDTRTLVASATEDLDLAGGLTNAFNTTLVFTKIKGIIISAAAGNTNNVIVGGKASTGFLNWVGDITDTIVVRPGGTFCLVAPDSTGYAVTATTSDILKIANSGGTTGVTYDIVLIGCV